MAQLAIQVISNDEEFRRQSARMVRASRISVALIDEHRAIGEGTPPDVVVFDIRGDIPSAMTGIERMRAVSPAAGIFAVAAAAEPDLILQAMRAGANEFFTWPPDETALHNAIRKAAGRREAANSRPAAATLAFFGAKGGAGTTTVAVNCGVELARLSKRSTVIVDLKPGLGEVSLFLGVRPKYSLIDAIDNLHRLDREFLRELVIKHKSGLEILAGSDLFDRPGPNDSAAVEEVLRLLGRVYEYILVDAGSQINACSIAALYGADALFLVANPDVPSVRNAQRLLDRVRQLGSADERVRILLNRAAEPYPIPPRQIESALGHPIHHTFPSDYKVVSTALNSGVPLALSGNSDLATQFDSFTRRLIDPSAQHAPQDAPGKKGVFGIDRIASLW